MRRKCCVLPPSSGSILFGKKEREMGAEGPRWTSGPGRHGEMGGKKKGKKEGKHEKGGEERIREKTVMHYLFTPGTVRIAGLPTLITRVVINALHGWGEVLGPRY